MDRLHFKPTIDQVNLGGLGVVFRLSGSDTHNAFAVVEHPLQPRTLASPVHTHAREDEFSFILQGQVTVMIADEVFTASPGDWIAKPRGIPHAFWNAQDTPARVLEIISPPGFEGYFREMADVAAHHPGDVERIMRIMQKYDLTSDRSSIPMLCQKYHLTLEGSPAKTD